MNDGPPAAVLAALARFGLTSWQLLPHVRRPVGEET